MALLLVIDDEPNIAFTIGETLGSDELRVISAATARQGFEAVRQRNPDLVLLDVRLPDMSGLDAFQQIHQIDPAVPVIIMTAFATTETAIEAMRRGAFDYFVKPVDLGALRFAIHRAIDVSNHGELPANDRPEAADGAASELVGRSAAMQDVYKAIGRVAQQNVTVLLMGESGTGKELAARAIHQFSHRAHRPMITVNCAALPEALLESELFGHEKGAFNGADKRHIGKFEQVNGGTIFLDEIGDMSAATQAKALRLLQQQEFERVGGSEPIKTDVRVIAATNRDLPDMVARNEFRRDLYYRLSGYALTLPPLRDHVDDIPALVDYFLRVISREHSKPARGVSPEALTVLRQHTWPGNVRELSNAIRYGVLHAQGEVITSDCLPRSCRRPAAGETSAGDLPSRQLADVRELVTRLLHEKSPHIYRQVSQAVDLAIVEEVLRATSGNQLQAAEKLGISRMTLRAKLRMMREASDHRSP